MTIPLVDISRGRFDAVPLRILVGETSVEALENIGLQRGIHRRFDFSRGRPDVGEVDRLAIGRGAESVFAEIDVNRASDRISDNQWRRHQEIRFDRLVNPGFKVAVARKDRRRDDVLGLHHVLNAFIERTGVADASGAAVADRLEPKLIELVLQAGFVQVIRHDTRSGSERSFHRWLHGQTKSVGFFRQQARGEHDAGVGGIGAARNRRDQNRTVGDGIADAALAIHGNGCRLGLGLAVAIGCGRCEDFGPFCFQRIDVNAILRALWSSNAGFDAGDVELNDLAKFQRILVCRDAPQTLRFVIIFHGLAEFLTATRAAKVTGSDFIDAEKAHGRTVFRSHVGDGGTIGQRQSLRAGTIEFHKLANDFRFAKHFRHAQHEIGRRDTCCQFAAEVNPHHFRHQERYWLTEHARFCLNAPHAPTHDAEAVDHGRMRVGANKGIGIKHAIFFQDALRQILEVHLVNNANAGRYHFESIEGLLTPFQELIAFAVAMELEVEIARERITRAGIVDLHTVIDYQIHGNKGLDHLRIFAHTIYSRAHRSEVHEQRNPGKVLQHDAGDNKRDFIIARIFGLIIRKIRDVLVCDFQPIMIAQQAFKHDTNGDRQARKIRVSLFGQCGKRVKFALLARTRGECAQCIHECVGDQTSNAAPIAGAMRRARRVSNFADLASYEAENFAIFRILGRTASM